MESRTIWKFPLEGLASKATVTVEMPPWDILTVGLQSIEGEQTVCVWAEVYLKDGQASKRYWKPRTFALHVTGGDIPMDRDYVGTVHLPGPFVFHLYELTKRIIKR